MEFVQTSTDDDTNNDPETWHGMSMVLTNAMKRPSYGHLPMHSIPT